MILETFRARVHAAAPHVRELIRVLREDPAAIRVLPAAVRVVARLILWPVLRDRVSARVTGSRPGLAYHVLRGRPLVYRVHLQGGGLVVNRDRTRIQEVVIVGADTGVTVASTQPTTPRKATP